jgi:putative tryptophan/tyrosine transport system substrate-binding protein
VGLSRQSCAAAAQSTANLRHISRRLGHHQPEAQRSNSSAIHKLAGRLPHLCRWQFRQHSQIRGRAGRAHARPHSGFATVPPLQQATATVPIVFVNVPDPVGAGFVESLARPGGNTTGFTLFEYGTSGKWLELLKEIAPWVTRVAIARDPAITAGIGQWGAIQSVAPSLGVELTPINVREAAEIERAVAAFARDSNGGLIVTGSALTVVHRDLLAALAARHKLPAVYFLRAFVTVGGLISYGPDVIDQYRRAAGYADRILKGEKPADLPVQAPTKYELVINLKTAKALGLNMPPTLLARADEVIE